MKAVQDNAMQHKAMQRYSDLSSYRKVLHGPDAFVCCGCINTMPAMLCYALQ